MNERDKELADEAEAYADRDFKGEINWAEAYESKLIQLVRADTMEAATRAANQSWMLLAKAMIAAEREACLNCYSPDDTATDWADKIRARGNT